MMYRKVSSIFLALLGQALATANQSTKLISCAAATNTIAVDAVCLLGADSNSTVVAVANTTILTLQNENIVSVDALPLHAQSIDLSNNAIQSMTANTTGAETIVLNLAHNSITSSSSVSFPSSVKYLDLSFNNIQELNASGYNWRQLGNLTSLNLSSNNMKRLTLVSFPSSLSMLDLSNNSFEMLQIDVATYNQWARARFMLTLGMTQEAAMQVRANCPGQTIEFSDGVVCVGKSSKDFIYYSWDVSSFDVLTDVAFAVVLVIIVVYFIRDAKRRRERRELEGIHERGTLTSSACVAYVLEPMQYAATLTPVAHSTTRV
ncbi:hypothetical protein AeMF1_014296 [Aphanomyces euteiches]|nr:hypothetical protein AeMF1_014296 [Aphanomyces euteiches]KAH9182028.1 hypothetical protein AeNC1_015997 [Aphanomyces euteiches]